jgi:mannan endo-1,4-beta-mannosidase
VFDAPNMLNRSDPRLSEPMAAMRKLSAALNPTPVTANASAEAKDLLARLYSVSGRGVLGGQENDSRAVAASTAHVARVTAKTPAIYAAEVGISKDEGAGSARQAVVEEAKRQAKNGAIVGLSWQPARPTDDKPAAEQTSEGALTDFEWNELLTPDTNLYKRWCAQVDQLAGYLTQLQDAKIAVLWRPYPEQNAKNFWWAGRKGLHGSLALYQQLFNRLVNHNGLRNLIWVWEADPPGYGPNATVWSDYFPGLLYVDALALNVEYVNSHFPMDKMLSLTGAGKPIGIEIGGEIPDPSVFSQQSWSWFLLAPQKEVAASTSVSTPAAAPAKTPADQAIEKLYADPRVMSQPTATSAASK